MSSTTSRERKALPPVRALLLLPDVCGLPGNLNPLISELLADPRIVAVCSIRLSRRSVVGLAARLILGSGWRSGSRLLWNLVSLPGFRRTRLCGKFRRCHVRIRDVDQELRRVVATQHVNTMIHMRTRWKISQGILSTLPYGCLNLHNGLLPTQRGVQSDLRALARGDATGFSLHFMNDRFDDGPLMYAVMVNDGRERDYRRYLRTALKLHGTWIRRALDDISNEAVTTDHGRVVDSPIVYSRVPSIREMWALRGRGMRF